jgi:hypothetical protein
MRKKTDADELKGWRIIRRRNDALGMTVYRVYLPGHIGSMMRAPSWEDFDNYDDALKFYHDMTGWRVVEETQP